MIASKGGSELGKHLELWLKKSKIGEHPETRASKQSGGLDKCLEQWHEKKWA